MSEVSGGYRYRGARALVLLHDAEMRRCVAVWQEAKVLKLALPETSDEDYASLEHLLLHILRASRGYLV